MSLYLPHLDSAHAGTSRERTDVSPTRSEDTEDVYRRGESTSSVSPRPHLRHRGTVPQRQVPDPWATVTLSYVGRRTGAFDLILSTGYFLRALRPTSLLALWPFVKPFGLVVRRTHSSLVPPSQFLLHLAYKYGMSLIVTCVSGPSLLTPLSPVIPRTRERQKWGPVATGCPYIKLGADINLRKTIGIIFSLSTLTKLLYKINPVIYVLW